MKIELVFPSVKLFFNEAGISSSAAAAQKNANTNAANDLKKRLTPSNYYNNVDYLFGGQKVETSTSPIKNPLKQDEFNSLETIAKLHLDNALLGQAIKYKEYMRETVQKMTDERIADIFDIEIPKGYTDSPRLKNAFITDNTQRVTDVEVFCNLEKVEDMYRLMNDELLAKCAPFYKEAIKAEAIAATYGKVVSDETGFLRKLFTLEENVVVRKTIDKGTYLREENELAYNKEEWKKLRDSIYETYTNEQKKRNSFVKQIKDAARELTTKYYEEHKVELQKVIDMNRDYFNLVNLFKQKCSSIRIEMLKEVADLKI